MYGAGVLRHSCWPDRAVSQRSVTQSFQSCSEVCFKVTEKTTPNRTCFAIWTVPAPSAQQTQLSRRMSCPATSQCALPAPWLFPSCCASCQWRPGLSGDLLRPQSGLVGQNHSLFREDSHWLRVVPQSLQEIDGKTVETCQSAEKIC